MDEQALVKLANEVLSKLPGSVRVRHYNDINSEVFVTLYEGLFAEALPDVIRHPKRHEDEVHNIQAVIDTLSLDILNTSLSHLSGEAVVARNPVAVKSLLDIFEWLFEYILEKIGSETSSDVGQEVTLDDPDLVTSEVIDSILEKELGKNYSSVLSRDSKNISKTGRSDKTNGNSTAELIALGQNSRDFSKTGSPDRTADIIALGESRYNARKPPTKHRPKTVGPSFSKSKPKPQQSKRNGELINTHKGLKPDRHSGSDTKDSTAELVSDELSSIRLQDSGVSQNGDLPKGTIAQIGVSSGGFGRTDYAAVQRPIGSGSVSNGRISSPTTNGDLSTGPFSSDSERGYMPDRSLDTSPDYKKETTADLIRESESLQKRLGLTSQDMLSDTTSPKKVGDVVSGGLESTLASSMSYPKPVDPESGTRSTDFDHIGMRPRSLVTSPTADGYRDNMANSLPLGHQYHSYTHHLYHHYPPGPPAQPLSTSLPSHYPKTSLEGSLSGQDSKIPSQPASTQVTPGRFADTVVGDHTDGIKSRDSGKERMGYTLPASFDDQHLRPVSSKSYSYDNLRYLIEDTMNMSERALQSSPLKNKHRSASAVAVNGDGADDDLTKRLRHTLQKLHSSEESNNDRSRSTVGERSLTRSSPRRQENMKPKTQSILSPKGKKVSTDRSPRKVSFLTGKSDRKRNVIETKVRDSSPDSSLSSPTSKLRHQGPVKGSSRHGKTRPLSATSRPRSAQTRATHGPKKTTSRAADKMVRTAGEYFDKYYSRGRVTSSQTTDDSYRSDGEVDYATTPKSDISQDAGDFKSELDAYKQELLRRSKQVRFDDILDDSAPGKMGGIRRKLAREEQRTRFRSEFLKDVYDQELIDFEDGIREQMGKLEKQSKEVGKEYKKKVAKSPNTAKYKPARKYAAPKSILLPKSKAKNRTKSGGRTRKRSASASPAVGRSRSPVRIYDNEILPWLLEEFPFLHISTEALHNMWRKSAKQMEVLTKTDQYVKAKKNRAQAQIEEAEYKQKLLADIAKKELAHNARMREIEERRKQQHAVKASIRDKRQQHARVRKYYDEYSVRMRSKTLKKRTREELVFKKLFEEGLKTQRDRIQDLRSYSRDQREARAKKQRDELESIENFYRDRFAMLAEALELERQERVLKNKAQQKVVDSLNREFRKKTEKEIEQIQDQIFRDEDDEYFRQLDADRLRQELHLARYKARV